MAVVSVIVVKNTQFLPENVAKKPHTDRKGKYYRCRKKSLTDVNEADTCPFLSL